MNAGVVVSGVATLLHNQPRNESNDGYPEFLSLGARVAFEFPRTQGEPNPGDKRTLGNGWGYV